jgi:hypothetical protein
MWNGNVGTARALFLAALIVSAGGCDSGTTPPLVPKAASHAPQSHLPNVRYQVDPAHNHN